MVIFFLYLLINFNLLFTERVLSLKKWLVFCSKLPKEFLGKNDLGIQLLILNSTNNFLVIILLFGHFFLRNFSVFVPRF